MNVTRTVMAWLMASGLLLAGPAAGSQMSAHPPDTVAHFLGDLLLDEWDEDAPNWYDSQVAVSTASDAHFGSATLSDDWDEDAPNWYGSQPAAAPASGTSRNSTPASDEWDEDAPNWYNVDDLP